MRGTEACLSCCAACPRTTSLSPRLKTTRCQIEFQGASSVWWTYKTSRAAAISDMQHHPISSTECPNFRLYALPTWIRKKKQTPVFLWVLQHQKSKSQEQHSCDTIPMKLKLWSQYKKPQGTMLSLPSAVSWHARATHYLQDSTVTASSQGFAMCSGPVVS